MTKIQVLPSHNLPKITLRSAVPPPPEDEAPLPVSEDSAELGAHKTVTQHLGNAGFGMSSVAAFGDGINALMSSAAQIPGAELVPGLNVGVAAVEGYNSIQKLREHEPIVAATSAGNALGSMGTFLGQVAAGHALVNWQVSNTSALLGVGAGFGVLAGGLGIAAGVAEIKQGRETHSTRTTAMGCLDISSGVVSLGGAAAMAAGAAPLGVGLMMAANLVDVAGIGVDYLWKRMDHKKSESTPDPSLGSAPAPGGPPGPS